ncbi:MAG TPA: hypothetical protein VF353_01890, partial [Candidatus Binatia bacterium]
ASRLDLLSSLQEAAFCNRPRPISISDQAIAKPASRQSQLRWNEDAFQPFHRCSLFQSFQSFS